MNVNDNMQLSTNEDINAFAEFLRNSQLTVEIAGTAEDGSGTGVGLVLDDTLIADFDGVRTLNVEVEAGRNVIIACELDDDDNAEPVDTVGEEIPHMLLRIYRVAISDGQIIAIPDDNEEETDEDKAFGAPPRDGEIVIALKDLKYDIKED